MSISGEAMPGEVFRPEKMTMNLAFQVMANMLRGHAAAYRMIHMLQPEAQVGIALNYRDLQPARPWFPLDGWIARQQARVYNDSFPVALKTGKLDAVYKSMQVPEAVGTQDFLGRQLLFR